MLLDQIIHRRYSEEEIIIKTEVKDVKVVVGAFAPTIKEHIVTVSKDVEVIEGNYLLKLIVDYWW